MLDSTRASQLLKSSWRNPGELAREIYSIVTSKEPRKLEAPLTIVVPSGATGLKISRSPTPESQPRRQAPRVSPGRESLFVHGSEPFSRFRQQLHDQVKVASQAQSHRIANMAIREGATPVTVGDAALTAGFDSPNTFRPSTYVFHDPFRDDGSPPSVPFVPSTTVPSQSRSSQAPVSRPEITGPVLYADTPEPIRGQQPQPSFVADQPTSKQTVAAAAPRAAVDPYATRHIHPLVEIDDTVLFAGPPVQFDTVPRLFNPRTRTYDPIVDWGFEELTHIPRSRPVLAPRMGKFVSGTSPTWTVTIYPDGKPPNSGDGSNPTNPYIATVTVLGVPDGYAPNVDDWVGPILRTANQAGTTQNDYWIFPNTQQKFGLVGTAITAASGGTLGQGTFQFCTRSGAALTAAGAIYPILNAGGAISSGKYIQIGVTDGAWSTVVSPC